MRSFESNPYSLDELELECPYSKCERTFYTENPTAIYCCDSHRGKHFREKNREKTEHNRLKTKKFNENAKILADLYHRNFRGLSERELRISGFHFDALDKAINTEDARTCYIFFSYGLAISKQNSKQYEIFKITK